MEKNRAARELLLEQSFGILSTISQDVPGFPFGSVTPYCVDDDCRPILYISTIAQHTKNILADSRVSLTVIEADDESDDVQSRGRVTYIAKAVPVRESLEDIRARYVRYFPTAAAYDQTHDFSFFRLDPVRIRFIGGFGKIFWVEANEFTLKNPFSPEQQVRVLTHMNNDHHDALRHYCGGGDAVMVGIDSEGFDVLLESGRKRRFAFDSPIHTMEEARQALVAMAKH
jgi:putative heme iron utilization protein